jgi:Tfp pilus assembly protein FimV
MTATAPAFGTDHRFVRPVPRHRSAARRSRYLLPPRLLALLAATAVIWITMTAVQADQPPALETYAVSSGDTLWGIAAGVASEGSDVRQTIALIMDLNDLSGSTIHPGQTLVLPAGP